MSREDAGVVLDQVRKILAERECRLTDRELLTRFATNHDTESLAAVVQRHGPMVLSVCRRILFETHDVEDAFQATFLILVRKAGSNKWNESIGAWLHVVACRVALRLRRETRRCRSLETNALASSGDPLVEVSGRELCAVLDEELSGLAEKYRTPLVLCCLEGLTRDEAARHCDLSLDKLKRRLAKGRVLLRRRLTRRGFAPSAVMAAALCSQASARFVIPGRLVQAVMGSAVQVASSGGPAVALCSARASALAQSVVGASAVARLKLAITATLVLFVAGAGVGLRLADAPSPQAIKVDKPAKEIAAQAIETQNVVDKKGQSENNAATAPAGQDNSVEWPLFRRNSSRTAVGAGRALLLKPSWSRRTLGGRAIDDESPEFVLDKETRRLLETALHQQVQTAKPLLSGMVPIAVADKVIYRNYVGIVAANRRSGKNEWDSYLILASLGRLLNDLDTRGDIRDWLKQYSDQSQQAVAFENSLIGTLSADHVHVYIVDDLALPPPTPLLGPGWWSPNISKATLQYVKQSRLVALNLETGKISWERGDPLHDSSQLALSHFFGPPLPIASRLYALSEKNDEFRLVCLEPDEGKLVWSLKLDTVGVALPKDPRRRMHAAVLAYAGGVLVCPTNDGTVFGIDLVKRQAVWAFRYREKPKPQPAGKDDKSGAERAGQKADAGNVLGEWKFPAAVIQGDYVVFTAPDRKPIYCLGLKDGVLRWKAERQNDLYLAGVFNGKVVLAGSKSCRALDLADGTRQLWQVETGMPSGLGIANGSEYFLPLRSGELLTIDLTRGTIAARASNSKKQVLGNLIFCKDSVISQTETEVSCFPQKPAP